MRQQQVVTETIATLYEFFEQGGRAGSSTSCGRRRAGIAVTPVGCCGRRLTPKVVRERRADYHSWQQRHDHAGGHDAKVAGYCRSSRPVNLLGVHPDSRRAVRRLGREPGI